MNYVKLKDVCTINMGQSPSSDSYNENGHGVPFFQGNADFGERYPVTRKWCSAPTKIAAPEDILISVRAPIGAMNYAKEECCIGRGLAALTPNRAKVSSEYIFWLLKGKNEELNSKGTGSTFKAIRRNILEETLVPDISLEKQTECSIILEKVYRVILSRKQQLQKLDELVKARFVEMFGDYLKDDRRPLSEVAIITGGLTKNSNRNTFETKMPYLRVANVFYNRLDLREILEIGVKEEEIEKTLLQAGDLLFVEGNGSIEQIGRVAIWDGSIDPILHQNHLIKARFNNEIIAPEYALFYFMLQDGRQQIISKSVSTSGLNTLSVNKVSSLLLPIPPIALQKQFGEFIKQTDKSKVAVQKALDEAQLLFDSLMQKYFG